MLGDDGRATAAVAGSVAGSGISRQSKTYAHYSQAFAQAIAAIVYACGLNVHDAVPVAAEYKPGCVAAVANLMHASEE